MYRTAIVRAIRPSPSSSSLLRLPVHRFPPPFSQIAQQARFSALPVDPDGSHHDERSAEATDAALASAAARNVEHSNPVPDFKDSKAAFGSKTTAELVRAGVCFSLCHIPVLVNNAESLLNLSRRILGGTLTDAALRATLFGHFCAGQDERKIQPVLDTLEANGIGSILDYAAENEGDLDTSTPPPLEPAALRHVREYDYESEAQCDAHVQTFKKCIHHVAQSGVKDGYAAIKVTALGNPKLLAKISQAIIEVKRLFKMFDLNGDGYVTHDEFRQAYTAFFRADEQEMNRLVRQLDPDDTGRVDYITWSLTLTPRDLPSITSNCLRVGPLATATPTPEEIGLMEAMYQRAYDIAEEASRVGTRLLIDAEQTKFQPAIDNLVLDLQQKYNSVVRGSNNSSGNDSGNDKPIIYNTYQCYLKDSSERLRNDFERSQRLGYHFGAKLVRGAYMETERREAEALGFESPVHDTVEDTHASYNDNVRFLLEQSIASPYQVEVMCATHNRESIEKAIDVLNEQGISRKDSIICFAQLYGMSDNLSFNLGKHGYRAYKYVPYGQVHEVMPYLLRRARENSAIVGGAVLELDMIKTELKRRFRQALSPKIPSVAAGK